MNDGEMIATTTTTTAGAKASHHEQVSADCMDHSEVLIEFAPGGNQEICDGLEARSMVESPEQCKSGCWEDMYCSMWMFSGDLGCWTGTPMKCSAASSAAGPAAAGSFTGQVVQ